MGGEMHSQSVWYVYCPVTTPSSRWSIFPGAQDVPQRCHHPTSLRIGQCLVWTLTRTDQTRMLFRAQHLLNTVRLRFVHSVACSMGRFDCCVVSMASFLKSLRPWPCRSLSQAPDLPGKLSETPPDKLVDSANARRARDLHHEQGPGLRASTPSLCHHTTSRWGPSYREGDRGPGLRAAVGSHGRHGWGPTWGVALDCSAEGG